jgi:alpha-glucosidase
MTGANDEQGDRGSWWRSGVLYQLYPRSFADSNGDGHGDLQGIIEHLDHLAWLGVDGIWLNPINPSPNADWGYDVADYTGVEPDFGDLEVLDRLVAGARERGIRVILDLVPNHTSDRHPWFLDARSSRTARHRDWYVWADAQPDGGLPNNWASVFGGSAWTWDEPTQQYYLHNFLAEQPDLNWWNDEVRAAFDDIMRFWFDRGISGFRIDVAHGIVKDVELRDNPPATPGDDALARALGQRQEFSMNRPEVHDVLRRWRAIADTYEHDPILLGETWVPDISALMRFYGDGTDELHLALNVPFVFAELGTQMRAIVEREEAVIPDRAWPTWTGSNHDAGRFITRWCGDDDRKIRAALVMLLTLRGTPILYYGDEIGMPEVAVARDRIRDPVGVRGWPDDPGRDRARTPMAWTGEPGGGFTRPDVEPWLPGGEPASRNVADEHDDPGSVLRLTRDLISLRRERTDLRSGSYATLEAPEGVWAWRRGDRTLVVLNLTEAVVDASLGRGEVLVSTHRDRDGERIADGVRLHPWEALVIAQHPQD